MRRTVLVLTVLVVAIVCVLFLYLLFWNKVSDVQNDSPLIRQTSNGLVEGNEKITSLGQKYYAFYGIPYAAPPITGIDQYTGERVDRRFKAPEPLKANWTGILKNDDLNILCLTTQLLPESYHQKNYSEDCLFLNVFVPAGGAEKKTTLVYIHGAGMDGGVTTDVLLGPDFLLSQDNVIVHLEYRVQLFGFLTLGFGEYTGNMGLKDQQLGLKWVYENIENFSGKKDEIMIFGASVGASFVHAHMLNPESRKYFTRAFMSSGSVGANHLRRDSHLPAVQECLQINMTGMELVDYLKTASTLDLSNCNYLPWLIFMESPNAPNAFISQTPVEIYKSDKPPIMDAMFSIASQESVQFFSELLEWTEPSLKEFSIESNRSLPYDEYAEIVDPGKLREATEKLRKAYFPDTTNIDAIRQGNLDYHSDLVVRDDVLKYVAYQADVNNNSTDKSQHKNVFLLRLSTHSDLDTLETKHNKNYSGAAHSDDLCYMFHCYYLEDFQNVTTVHIQKKDEVYDMVIRRVKMITNFARFGNPSIEGDTPFSSSKSSNEIYCNEISNDSKIRITMDIKKELKFDIWREVEDIYQKWIHMRRY